MTAPAISPARVAAHRRARARPDRGRVRRPRAARRGARARPRATARWPSSSPSARSSGGSRWTTSSRSAPTASSSRPSAPRCSSASSSSCSSRSPTTPPSARPSSWPSPARATGWSTPCCARVQRDGAELPSDATPQGAAIRHSHPEWLVRMWWDELGAEETRALLAADNEPAELALRVNTLAAGVHAGRPPRPARGRRDRRRRARSTPSRTPAGRRAGSRPSRARRSGWRRRWRRSRASACSTCARRPAARRRTSPRSCRASGEVVAVERHAGRARGAAAHVRAPARDQRHAWSAPTRRPIATTAASTACCSTRRAAGWARCARTPTCAGARRRSAIARLARPAGRPARDRARAPCDPAVRRRWCSRSAPSRAAEERLRGTSRWRTLPHRDGTDGFYIARDGG